jgi:transposase InsO family protein
MTQTEISHPIHVTLDGRNYFVWSQSMRSFIKGRKLWFYVTGEMKKPVKGSSEDENAFRIRLIEWDSNNHQILTWLRNTSIPSISNLLGNFDDARTAWDMLAKRYSSSHGTREYQLSIEQYQIRQDPGQSINDFFARFQFIWDQLDLSDPPWDTPNDAMKYATRRDQMCLYQFLMALHDDYEPVRGQLLHQLPTPSLDAALNDLVREETRLQTLQAQNKLNVLATTSPLAPLQQSDSDQFSPNTCRSDRKSNKFCRYCKKHGHTIETCFRRNRSTAAVTHGDTDQTPTAAVAPAPSGSAITLTTDQLEDIIAQALVRAGNASSSSALSVLPGKFSSWLLDSACCNHMTPYPSFFSHTSSARHAPTIHTANGSTMLVRSIGTVSTSQLSISDVFHVPKLSYNLLSVGQLAELGYRIILDYFGCIVQDPRTGQELGTSRRIGRLFEISSLRLPATGVFAATSSSPSLSLWHSRLGHASSSRVQQLVSRGLLGPVSKDNFDCVSCQLGKQPALPFQNSESMSTGIFDLIHSDVWGPSPITSLGGSRYFVVFVDDYSRYSWVFLMRSRDELLNIYRNFANMVKTQFSKTIKVFRSDNARELTQHAFEHILYSHGTVHQFSCPGTSQQNGRAERKLRHILDTVRALLLSSKVPVPFWGEAVLTAAHAINRIPSPTISNQTPYERLFGSPPHYQHLRSFGSACFVLLQPHEHNKLEPRSRLCCFLGYGETQKGYRCYDPIAHRLRISRHVVFWEHRLFTEVSQFRPSFSLSSLSDLFPEVSPPSLESFPPYPAVSTSIPQTESSNHSSGLSSQETPHSSPESPAPAPSEDPAPATTLRRSSRVTTLPSHLRDFHCYTALATLHEPHSYREASSNPLWQAAMAEELDALSRTRTWDLVDLPPEKSVVGCKWVFKIKTRSDGSIERYKARLVAKGFTQEYGIDYEETFAPVARLSSVRTLLAVAASRQWQLFQMDVKNAFLNGDLSEEVYMQPPPGLSHPPDKVCRLRRALYGLKQAPRAWFAKFSSTVSRLGFSISSYDSALFLRRTGKGTILLLLYVDDMIITGDDLSGIQELKAFLSQNFEMKDLGHLSYFLGLEITSSDDGFYLTQAKYTSDLLSRAGLTDHKILDTPIEFNARLTPSSGELLPDPTLYRQLVGSLVYLTVTRPDISYAVHQVSQFVSAPRSTHYAAVLRILRYLKGTLFHGLHFSAQSPLTLRAYSDADWVGDPTDRRSTTGYCFLLGSSLISWRSKKQSVVARSSTEAEYRALADTTSELLWLRWLLQDLGVSTSSATPIYCDNRSAIQIARNDVFHERTKHIEIDCHLVRHHLLQGSLQLVSVSSHDQLADIFTKSHPTGRFRDLVSKLQLVSHPPP